MTDAPYRFALDRDRGFVRVDLAGFWNVETAQRFIVDYGRTMTDGAAAMGDIRLLVDQRAMDVQAAEIAQMLEAMLATSRPLPRKVAIISSRPLVRMQGKRMKVPSQDRWFDHEADALAWLLSSDADSIS